MRESTAANELSQALQDLRAMARTLDHPPALTRQVIAAVRVRLDEIERLLEPSPSPMAAPTTSALAPTSPDGDSGFCACPACHGGPAVIACRVCGRGMSEYVGGSARTCGRGSPRCLR